MDPEQQLHTPKIEDIATAVIEITAALHAQEHCDCCDRDVWRHLRLFIGHNNNRKLIWPRTAALHTQDRGHCDCCDRDRCTETSEALHWTQQQQQKIDIDPEQQLYTPKIEDIATAVIEMYGDIRGSSLDTTTTTEN
ncbi:hypothetical protein LAZ67_17002154 [Cordylochernes scorpioides]|uniref:Uncharacterized protein n=1 Tax=Cordylochernes scorpioides TaxID=51811 RepID=A0ABY6LDW8_9ARAC|nr:hypothetical protein LAZ67_17002154 [Cordylochernes scorpioides]